MDRKVNEIRHYTDANGRDYFGDWWLGLRDDKAKKAVFRRIDSMAQGNFGDCKPLRNGVWELRIDVGPGYRVYYAKDGLAVVLLLCGGDKRKQDSDIDRACGFWSDWEQRRSKEERQ
jgi:putative addiction module killer protein